VTTIRNVPPTPPPPTLPARDRTVLYFSNFIPEKGADTFLDVAEALGLRNLGVDFVLAGAPADPTFYQYVERRVAKSALGSRIRLLGPLAGDEKWHHLAAASVLVFPSRYALEAQPLVILEALAVGTRVVASDVGGVRDLEEGNHGLRLVPLEISAIVDAVEQALDAPVDFRAPSWIVGFASYQDSWLNVLDAVRTRVASP
jgi:glycosyltransferase involved in cell wall biosynthesis